MKNKIKIVFKRSSVGMRTQSDLNLNQVIELLKIPTQKRNKYDIKALQSYMLKNIKYFQKMIEESNSTEKISKIIQVLTYECFNKDEYIIKLEINFLFYYQEQ